MIEASSKSKEIRSVQEIHHPTMQEFLSKLAIWDFFEMSRDEFTRKSELDKELLIVKYYNSLSPGIGLLFVVWVSFFTISGSGLVSLIFLSRFCVEIVSSMISLSPASLFDKLILTGKGSCEISFFCHW